ncbi:MAG: tetratricopeptide repeat protein [Aggregatilineales bacterium]
MTKNYSTFAKRVLPRLALLSLCLLAVRAPHPLALRESLSRAASAFQAGHLGLALDAYHQALIFLPSDAFVLEQLYRAAFTARRYDLASSYLAQLTEQHGSSSALHRLWAEFFAAQGDSYAADAHRLAALQGTPEDASLLRALAESALGRRAWARAADYLERAYAFAPDDPDVRYALALYSLPDQPQRAAALLADLPDQPRFGSLDALRALIGAHGQAPSPLFAFRSGLALIEARHWQYAERALHLANAQGVDLPAARAFLGLAQSINGRDGAPLIEAALQAAPDEALVQYAAGLYWRSRGDVEQAIAALRLAYALDSQNAGLAAEIGQTYRQGGNLNEAARWLRNAVRLAPQDAALRRAAAAFYADENYALNGEGMTFLRESLAILPADPEIAANYGYALLYNGQVQLAYAELQRAVALQSQNPRARYYFAVLLEHQGDLQGAVESYRFAYQHAEDLLKTRAERALQRLDGSLP